MGLGFLAARGLTMTDARRITVGPIAAAYLEIQQGTVLVPGTDYEALQSRLDAAERRDAERIEEIEILQRQLDRFRNQAHGIPALAEHERLRQQLSERDAVLRDIRRYGAMGLEHSLNAQIDALLSSAEPVKTAPERYTCIGKGGEYELLGIASGAGTLNGLSHMVYRNRDGVMFVREPEDFLSRMEKLPAKGGDGESQA